MKKTTLRRMLALLCCTAMILPCVPAAMAAEEPLWEDSFETYSEQSEISAVWMQTGNIEGVLPKVSTDRADSGRQSMLVHDTADNRSFQARHIIQDNPYPAGTELIMTARYYVEETGGTGVVPYIALRSAGNTNQDGVASVYSEDQWDSLSSIFVPTQDNEALWAYIISNSATLSKSYWDDVKVQALTAELAAQYVDEKLFIPGNVGLAAGLFSDALGLTGTNPDQLSTYAAAMKRARQEKGAALTKAELQTCVDNIRMDELTKELEGATLSVGEVGSLSARVVEMPGGITAKWVSVSPAGKNITLTDGKATVTAVPEVGNEAYTAVLRLSTANRSVDINYNIDLVNGAAFDAEVVNRVKAELRANAVIGVSETGAVAVPEVTKPGVGVRWDRIKANPKNCLNLTNGQLKVKSIPEGLEYHEAVAVLKLYKGTAAVELEYSIVVYNDAYRILLPMANPGFEDVDRAGAPHDWVAATTNEKSFGEGTNAEVRTGERSFRFVDGDETGNYSWRSKATATPAQAGREYELSFWAKGTATASDPARAGVANYIEYQSGSGKLGQTDGIAIATNPASWTLIRQRGVAAANTKFVSFVPYGFVSTVCDVYLDDCRVWEFTAAGSVLTTDELLRGGGNADTLYKQLGITSLGVSGLNAANKEAYFTALTAKRANKGSALTAEELAAGVAQVNESIKMVNEKIAAENRTALRKIVSQITTGVTVDRIMVIELPKLNDNTVTAVYTEVFGDGAKRISLSGQSARVVSLPDYGMKSENATVRLSLTKGEAKETVDIKLLLKPVSKNMSELLAAAQALRVDSYLNGQPADAVVSALGALPAALDNGIAVTWQVLDSATLQPSGAVSGEGKITRPAYGEADAAVLLRANLSKGGETYTHDLHLIVPALGAEEARVMYDTNLSFEATPPVDMREDPIGWIKGIKWEDGRESLWTTYTDVVNTGFTGQQSLRITAGAKQWNNSRGAMIDFEACVMNSAVTTAREGYTYTLDAMVYTEDAGITPAVILRFWGNFGEQISFAQANYHTAPGETGTWKNLHASGVAPAGTIMVTAELNGGSKDGVTFFDDVRLREWAPVPNGSFDLGSVGWTTEGAVVDGTLTLTEGQSAVSLVRGADRGVTYFLTLDADGGKAALRFVDQNGKKLAEYSKDMKVGQNALFAYAPANTAGVQVVLTGAMTADNVKITRSAAGTGVTDGDFEISATAGVGTPWELTNATITSNTGKTGAGLTVKEGGQALSTVFPVEDGKGYVFSVDVKGNGAALQLNVYNSANVLGVKRKVVSDSDDWTTLTIRYDQLEEFVNSNNPEGAYGQLVLSGAAMFDNVKVYSISKNVSNYSMEDTKILPYGTFPFNWSGYGVTANYVNNQEGQHTEGVKSLAVDLFGLGEGGIRSSMLEDVKSGKAYEATIKAKGNGAKLSIEFWDQDFKKLGSESVSINSADFKEYSVVGTAPSGTIYASLAVGGNGVGSVVADEGYLLPVVRSVGTNVQSFIDDWFIADSDNVKRTLYPGEKCEIGEIPGSYPSAPIWDTKDQTYKLWYRVGDKLVYRTAKDAVSWGSVNKCYNAATGEEMVVGGYVVIDEDDPVKRYKGVFWNTVQSRIDGSYDYWSSPDGVNWTFEDKCARGQDVHTLSYDPYNDEYILTYKISAVSALDSETIRTHSVAVSKDMINWTEPVRQYTVGTPMDTVEENMIRTDGYGNGVYAMGDSYVGLNWRMLLYENESFGGILDSNLLFSRDLTEDWQRVRGEDGKAFVAIENGEYGAKDSGQIYTAADAIRVGDELWWLSYGLSRHHGYSSHGNYAGSYMAYTKWRYNGFASMDFSGNGSLTTEQFTLMGTQLHLNAKGNLTVELLDAKGAVVATAKFAGDSVDQVVTWDKSIVDQYNKVVSLRFTSSDAKLYTLNWDGSIFGDVKTDDWYFRAVNYAVDNGIMGGYGGGKFGPNDTLSRAMVVQMLYNKVGQPKISAKHGFSDVPADQWFNNAVTWGTKNGVMGGYGNGKFGPNDNVTVEQIAVILWNYSGNPVFNAKLGNVGAYSGWAENALTWATDKGILHGVNFKNATDNATRAQAAQMLTNFLRW